LRRIGILSGSGTARKRTIPALAGSEICQVTVVLGRDPDHVRQGIGSTAGIRLASTEREFADLRSYYDIIYISSPPFLHLSYIELAAQLGMPVICEKPLVAQREQLAPVLKLITESGIPFMLAHQIRHQLAFTALRDLVRDGRFDTPVMATLQWCFMMNHAATNARWKLDPLLGGSNAMFDCGVHAVDIAVGLFGSPVRVMATGHHVRTDTVLDSVCSIMDYPDFPVAITASQSASTAANDLSITFPDRVVRAAGLLGEKAISTIEVATASGTERWTFDTPDLYRAEVENFCESLDGSPMPGTTVAEAALAARVLFAVEDALLTGSPVELR
jgi:predicted dehydrogenase